MPADEKTPAFRLSSVPTEAKRGPGRPKGSTNRPKSPDAPTTKTEVDQALAVLDSMYDFIGMGLLMAQFPATAGHLTDQRDELRKSNEKALQAAPKLCRQIVKMGQTGGTGTFLITHAMLVFGLYNVGRMELDAKRAARAEEQARETQPESPYA